MAAHSKEPETQGDRPDRTQTTNLIAAFAAGATALASAAVAFVLLVGAVSFDVWSESGARHAGSAELASARPGAVNAPSGSEATLPVSPPAGVGGGLLTAPSPFDSSLVGSRRIIAPPAAEPEQPDATAPPPAESDGGTGIADEEEPLDPGTGAPPAGEGRDHNDNHGDGNRPPVKPPVKPTPPRPPSAPSGGDDDSHVDDHPGQGGGNGGHHGDGNNAGGHQGGSRGGGR